MGGNPDFPRKPPGALSTFSTFLPYLLRLALTLVFIFLVAISK